MPQIAHVCLEGKKDACCDVAGAGMCRMPCLLGPPANRAPPSQRHRPRLWERHDQGGGRPATQNAERAVGRKRDEVHRPRQRRSAACMHEQGRPPRLEVTAEPKAILKTNFRRNQRKEAEATSSCRLCLSLALSLSLSLHARSTHDKEGPPKASG